MPASSSRRSKDKSIERDTKYSRRPLRRQKAFGNKYLTKRTDSVKKDIREINLIVDEKIFETLGDLLVCSSCHSNVELTIVSPAKSASLLIDCQSCGEIASLDCQ